MPLINFIKRLSNIEKNYNFSSEDRRIQSDENLEFHVLKKMFPIIPHNFSTKSMLQQVTCASSLASSAVQPHKRERREQECGFPYAREDIPATTVSKGILLRHVMEQLSHSNSKIAVTVNKEGYLENLLDRDNWGWITKIKIANDCQSYNTLLRMSNEDAGVVILYIVHPIKKGRELSLWFSEDVIAKMSIPFLTLVNIQGDKRYVCHQCGRHYEFPNPLKVHLALNCDCLESVELWKRLQQCTEDESNKTQIIQNKNINKEDFLFKLEEKYKKNINFIENSIKVVPPESHSLSTVSNPSLVCISESEEEVRSASEPPFTRHSAFKPYFSSETKQETKGITSKFLYKKLSRFLPIFPQNILSPNTTILPPHNLATFSSNISEDTGNMCTKQAVEMETLVSNLGRSNQGHLCLYCGKLYSRKYGLKIHIRTHTGFKPLKCKYCLRPFGDPSNLNKHVRLHSDGETPYKCEQCGKILVRRRDLERHIKSRHQH